MDCDIILHIEDV